MRAIYRSYGRALLAGSAATIFLGFLSGEALACRCLPPTDVDLAENEIYVEGVIDAVFGPSRDWVLQEASLVLDRVVARAAEDEADIQTIRIAGYRGDGANCGIGPLAVGMRFALRVTVPIDEPIVVSTCSQALPPAAFGEP